MGVINKGSLKYCGTPSEMVRIAKDVTWVFEIPTEEFAQLPADLLIVHHIRLGENIRVRCLSETQLFRMPYIRIRCWKIHIYGF